MIRIRNLITGSNRRLAVSLVGAFLVLTAGLKAVGLMNGIVSYLSLMITGNGLLDVLAVIVELLAGIWMLVSKNLYWPTRLGVVLFTGLALTSLYIALLGQSSCGCFGRIEVNPWVTLLLDLVLAVVLIFCVGDNTETSGESVLGAQRIIVQSILILIVVALAFQFDHHSISSLRGDVLTVSPAITSLGQVKKNDLQTFNVVITNHMNETVVLMGGQSTCSCITTESLPVTVPAKSYAVITILVNPKGTNGIFIQRYTVMTSTPKSPILVAYVKGSISN